MKKTDKIAASTELSIFNKTMKEMCFNGAIMTSMTEQESGELWAKVTEIDLNGFHYYAMWEKDIFFGEGWRLLHFGKQPEVEPLWKEYVEFFKTKGVILGKYKAA